MSKKLYKSATDRKICGVCAGLAEYLGMDATVVRLVWLLFSIFGGTGILAYIISAMIIPEDPNAYDYTVPKDDYHDYNNRQQ